jgi:hypothetical protein
MAGTEYTVDISPSGNSDVELVSQPIATPNYDCVNDPIGSPNDETDYVYWDWDWYARDRYNMANPVTTGFSHCDISKIAVWYRAEAVDKGCGTDCYIEPGIRIGTKNYWGTQHEPAATWTNYSYEWSENPRYERAWSWSDIDSIIGQLRMVSNEGRIQCTQMWIRVHYTLSFTEEETVTMTDAFTKQWDKNLIITQAASLSDAISFYIDKLRLFETVSLTDKLIHSLNKPLYYYQPSADSQFTIREGDVLEFSGVELDDSNIRNDIKVIGNAVSASAFDDTSIGTYGRYGYRFEDDAITNSNDAVTLAAQILDNFKDPKEKGWVKVKGKNSISPRQKFTLDLPNLNINGLYEVVQYVHDISDKGFTTTIYFGEIPWDINRVVMAIKREIW